ncbi:cytochrome P450 [Oryctes borbonicus]|uniref:Cytochrome P450 n=1 Tax=Oryctes borbonicus TaxID=1629725 RepID=A0A0T6AX95_9SCAR|nr:cytochrome P450 [Oryctes borbonicus]
MPFVIEFIAGLVTLSFLFLLYVKYSQTYWSRKGIPYLKPHSLLGNIENPFKRKRGLALDVKASYDTFKRRKIKYGGIYFFTEPIFMPLDTDLIKNILSKDFPHFLGHGFQFNEKYDPLSGHLFNLEGEKWRNMRVKLSPTFTSGKMKYMFKTLLDCGGPMIDHVDNLCKSGESLDIKEILACYTTDIIGSCAFGLECNSFKDPNAEFRRYGRKLFIPSFKVLVLQFLIFWIPTLPRYVPLKFTPDDAEKFFINAVKNILDYRTVNNVKRHDFIQMFLEMQEKSKAEGTEGFTLNEIAAQAFIFFLAGFETSSTTMTFCLHELAFNQDIQDKLREEICETYKKNNGELTYDAIMEMKYMDDVLNETLRKYPPVPTLNRVCSVDYTIPDTNFTIRKGTQVFISSLGMHRDEEYYPNPTKFDPERFSEENKATRPAFSFLPFGEGPRICIGLRFGLMQAKVGLSMLLSNYKVKPEKNESYNIRFDPKAFILGKDGPVKLRTEKLTA